jgi:hypothetical protein
MLARASFLGALLAALAGCGDTYNINGGYTCTDPDRGHLGPNGQPDPCHEQDAGAGSQCAVGEYVHWRVPWLDPMLLWFGPPDQAPECPRGPASIAYEGGTDLFAPSVCEACTCDPPTGSCALPSKLTASTAMCYAPGVMTSFDAPASWDGECDSTTQVPAGKAYSLTIGALTMTESGCAPGPTIPAKVISLHWDTFARGCDVGLPMGPIERSICLPGEPLPPGFSLCIFQNGENDCPGDDVPGNVFTKRHIFYQGVQDDRQCSSCTCGAPAGSMCTGMLSIYKGGDLTCSGQILEHKGVSSEGPVCLDLAPPGLALGSKSADATTYLPGTCPATGGDASGIAVKTNPATLCCRP